MPKPAELTNGSNAGSLKKATKRAAKPKSLKRAPKAKAVKEVAANFTDMTPEQQDAVKQNVAKNVKVDKVQQILVDHAQKTLKEVVVELTAAKVAFTESNPNVRRDKFHREVAKDKFEFAIGRRVKVMKVVDRRGNVECILKGRIKSLTTAGAYVIDLEKSTCQFTEWFPYKSKMVWLTLG